jgi:hypothetical protein
VVVVGFYIVRVDCERLFVVGKFPDLPSAESEYQKLREIAPTRYLLLDYDPRGWLVPIQQTRNSTDSERHIQLRPSAANPIPDVRTILLKLEYAALSCRVAHTTRKPEARERSIRVAREALHDAKQMASRIAMTEGERLWFQSTAAAVTSEILDEMFRPAAE